MIIKVVRLLTDQGIEDYYFPDVQQGYLSIYPNSVVQDIKEVVIDDLYVSALAKNHRTIPDFARQIYLSEQTDLTRPSDSILEQLKKVKK